MRSNYNANIYRITPQTDGEIIEKMKDFQFCEKTFTGMEAKLYQGGVRALDQHIRAELFEAHEKLSPLTTRGMIIYDYYNAADLKKLIRFSYDLKDTDAITIKSYLFKYEEIKETREEYEHFCGWLVQYDYFKANEILMKLIQKDYPEEVY
jgi:hypothetical protein